MTILAIDTSTQILSVALIKNNQLLGQINLQADKNHSTKLMPVIQNLFKEVELTPDELKKIVVAEGPGSYTGIRIAVTTAKTLSWSLNIPLYSVSSLKALTCKVQQQNQYICPFFDARRNLIFTGLYYRDENGIVQIKEDRNVDFDDWLGYLVENINDYKSIMFISPDLLTFKEKIEEKLGKKAMFLHEIYNFSDALFLNELIDKPVEAHELTPNYLRLSEAEANWLKKQER